MVLSQIVTPPHNEKLTPFEKGLYDMVRSIKFKSVWNNFQSMLREDLNKKKSSRNFLVFADKTMNLYEMPPDQYKMILKNNMKMYCKADSNTKHWPKSKKTLQRTEFRGQDGMLR